MKETKQTEQQRVTVYMEKNQHRKLRAKLALQGLTVTEWVRRQVDKFLTE